jgi:Predicted 3'-5' exonuclease related to the exonuclease domain of PolB
MLRRHVDCIRQFCHRGQLEYTDDALDLCDALGSFGPGAKVKLDEISKMLGLKGKPAGVDGSRVGDGSSWADQGSRPVLRE